MASATFPGWGQIRTGRRRAGNALSAGSLTVVAAAAVALAAEGPLGAAAWLLDPDFLVAMLVVNLTVALVRGWSAADAWKAAGGHRRSVTLVVVLLVVLGPHAALAYYGMETRSTLLEVFPEPSPGPSTPPSGDPETTTTTVSTTTSPPPTVAPTAPSTTTIPVTTTAAPATTTTTISPLGRRLTLLLLGGDAGPGRRGLRTDTMVVATVDTATGDAALFGLPRNMGGFTFSDGSPFPGMSQGLLNEVYQWGWRHAESFPGVDPGAAAAADVAEHLLGLPIDHFVLVEMAGFAEMVDVLGGVTVQVPRNIEAPLYDRANGDYTMITIPRGEQHMDGDLALAFSRSRTGSNDYDRMGRQRCVLAALAEQTRPLDLFAGFPGLLDALERNVSTDIPLSKIPFLINLAPRLDADRIVVVGFDRGYRVGRTENGLARPDVEGIRSTVAAVIATGDLPNGPELPTARATCH